jgi:hypothetical protein
MWLFSQTHLKTLERFFIPNYHFYRTDRFLGRKAFPITMYTSAICAICTLDERPHIFIRDNFIFSSERTSGL